MRKNNAIVSCCDRIQSVIQGNPNLLWQDFPALRQQIDSRRGINAEIDLIQTFHPLNPSQADLMLETYAPF